MKSAPPSSVNVIRNTGVATLGRGHENNKRPPKRGHRRKEILKVGPVSLYKLTSASESVSVTGKMYTKIVFVCCLALAAHARTTSNSQNAIPVDTPRSEESSAYSFLSDMRYVYKVYQECAATDLSSCLKLKLIGAIDRVARAYSSVPLFDGVAFVKEPTSTPEEPPKSEADIEANLPRALSEREDALNSIIADKLFKFFESHTLQVSESKTSFVYSKISVA